MWPDKPLEFIKLKEDIEGLHYGLYQDNKLVSVISCFQTSNGIQFRKFATLADMQNHGFGTSLLSYIISEVKKKGAKRLWCNARLDKKQFYQKFGLAETKERFFKEGVEFTIMESKFH